MFLKIGWNFFLLSEIFSKNSWKSLENFLKIFKILWNFIIYKLCEIFQKIAYFFKPSEIFLKTDRNSL